MKKSILCSANLVSVRFPSIFCVIKGPIFRIGNLHCSLLQILHYSDIYVPRVLSISSTFHFFRFTFLGRVNRMIVKKFRTTWYTLGTWKRLAFGLLINLVCVCASEQPSAESSRSVRGLGKGVSGKPYPRLCNARRPRLEPRPSGHRR